MSATCQILSLASTFFFAHCCHVLSLTYCVLHLFIVRLCTAKKDDETKNHSLHLFPEFERPLFQTSKLTRKYRHHLVCCASFVFSIVKSLKSNPRHLRMTKSGKNFNNRPTTLCFFLIFEIGGGNTIRMV